MWTARRPPIVSVTIFYFHRVLCRQGMNHTIPELSTRPRGRRPGLPRYDQPVEETIAGKLKNRAVLLRHLRKKVDRALPVLPLYLLADIGFDGHERTLTISAYPVKSFSTHITDWCQADLYRSLGVGLFLICPTYRIISVINARRYSQLWWAILRPIGMFIEADRILRGNFRIRCGSLA